MFRRLGDVSVMFLCLVCHELYNFIGFYVLTSVTLTFSKWPWPIFIHIFHLLSIYGGNLKSESCSVFEVHVCKNPYMFCPLCPWPLTQWPWKCIQLCRMFPRLRDISFMFLCLVCHELYHFIWFYVLTSVTLTFDPITLKKVYNCRESIGD